MPQRKQPLTSGNYYHIFNRGVEKRKTFTSERDYRRFLETLEHVLIDKRKFARKTKMPANINENPKVEVIAFCLMPNHFHLLLRQIGDSGISELLQRLTNSYTKYFNLKYKRTGPLFEGRFKAVLIQNNDQLMHISRYIHLNPVVSGIVNDPRNFEWSSYRVFVGEKQSNFIKQDVIINNFDRRYTYEQFVLDQIDYGKKLEELKHLYLE